MEKCQIIVGVLSTRACGENTNFTCPKCQKKCCEHHQRVFDGETMCRDCAYEEEDYDYDYYSDYDDDVMFDAMYITAVGGVVEQFSSDDYASFDAENASGGIETDDSGGSFHDS